MQAVEKGKLVIDHRRRLRGPRQPGGRSEGRHLHHHGQRPQLGRRHQQRDGRHLGRRGPDDRHHGARRGQELQAHADDRGHRDRRHRPGDGRQRCQSRRPQPWASSTSRSSPTGVDNTYRGTIDFDAQDPPLFGPQLLTVAVTNVNGRRTEVQLIFIIDNEGPTITSTLPVPGQIAGGIVLISAKVDDPAGILDSSVIAVIARRDRHAAVRAADEARRRRRLHGPVRQLAVREVPGSARPALPDLSDGVVPRLRSGRQRDRPRLRVHRSTTSRPSPTWTRPTCA